MFCIDQQSGLCFFLRDICTDGKICILKTILNKLNDIG